MKGRNNLQSNYVNYVAVIPCRQCYYNMFNEAFKNLFFLTTGFTIFLKSTVILNASST